MQWIKIGQYPNIQLVRRSKRLFVGGDDEKMDTSEDLPGVRHETRDWKTLYTEVQFMAAGGQGSVYRGKRMRDGQTVAIKVMDYPPSLSGGGDPFAEIKLNAKIACPPNDQSNACSVIPIYDAWLSPDQKQLLIEMQYVEGGDVYDVMYQKIRVPPEWIDTTGQSTSAFWEFMSRNLMALSATLSRIHRQCILHRDIKPENLLYESATRRLYFADFGLACVLPRQCPLGSGTLPYMDPTSYLTTLSITQTTEPESLDPRSDTYSLGLSLYELLTREPYGIPRKRLPTTRDLTVAYNTALQRLRQYKERDTTKEYHVMFQALGEMIHPFDREKRPTLDSIVNALQHNQISLLQHDTNTTNSVCQ